MTPLLDLIVLIPGILGSRLVWEKPKGRPAVWDSSLSVLAKVLLRGDGGLSPMALPGPADDPITADGLIQGITLVPGFKKIKGYREISHMIRSSFIGANPVRPGDPPGFIEFPYDWRQDNRATAARLKTEVGEALHKWKAFKQVPNAKAILVAHSMGGLVASYYIECLEGWKDCRALIALGTPFQGSLRTVNYLANGYRLYGVDTTRLMTSFPSTYQLLPTYEAVNDNGVYRKFGDAPPGLPPRLRQEPLRQRVDDGLKFHEQISNAAEENRSDRNVARPDLVCFVGTDQTTFQSAQAGDRWTVCEHLPDGVEAAYADGDGVVPHYSAIHPAAAGQPGLLHSFAEAHENLCANDTLLRDLHGVLRQYQTTAAQHRPALAGVAPTSPLRVEGVEDCYWQGEDVNVTARVAGPGADVPLVAEVWKQSGDGNAEDEGVGEYDLNWAVDRHLAEIPDLDEGLYRIKVRTASPARPLPEPVTNVFAVFPKATAD